VQPKFLHNVTPWFGCPWTLPTYVAELGGLGMVVLGLCYIVLAGDGARRDQARHTRAGGTRGCRAERPRRQTYHRRDARAVRM